MHLTGTPKLTYELSGEDLQRVIVEIGNQIGEQVQRALKLQSEKPMTTADALKFLQIHPTTLYRRIKKGGLPCHRDGDTYYFYASELNDYIKGKQVMLKS
ncbi:MAG TPA: helix-turn-helix domain-containing protein [Cyclobacteriaceae bacterium]|nr:helix-turn-helix domain-containing protein [Cyclobacteriaceae bacterium]